MDFIDFNCTIGHWPYEALGAASAEEVFRELERVGIKRAVFSSFGAIRGHTPTWDDANEKLFEEAERFPGMIPCPDIVPLIDGERGWANTAAYLDHLRARGAKLVRVSPAYNGFSVTADYFDDVLGYLERYRMPILIPRYDLPGGFDDVERLCKAHPQLPVVILENNHDNNRGMFFLLRRFPNLYFEISFLIEFGLPDKLVEFAGSRGLLFGTRTPFMEPARMVARMAYGGFSEEDRYAICCGNAERLLAEAGKERI